jgi:hypothetical protein
MDVDTSVPTIHDEALPVEVVEEKWDIRVWARITADEADTPIYGFTMRPRITILALYIHVWLLLPTTEIVNAWEIHRWLT